MAYYAPFFRQPYYDQMQNPNIGQFNQQIQQSMPQQFAQTMSQQQNNGLVWVQGEAGAKSYLVAPGNTVMLMDSEGKRFYLKTADSSGMPMPLRVFEYKECSETNSQSFGDPVPTNTPNFDNFITREEFEQRIASVTLQCQCKNQSKKKVTEESENV